MKAYLVVSGEYSDFHVDRVFLDLEKAEKFVEVSNRAKNYLFDECSIRTYDISDNDISLDKQKIYYQCEWHSLWDSIESYACFDGSPYEPYEENNVFKFCVSYDAYVQSDGQKLRKIAQDLYAAYRGFKHGIS